MLNLSFYGPVFFLGMFSLFLIYSLFQIGIEKRMSEYGILQALGIGKMNQFLLILSELWSLLLVGFPVGTLFGNGAASCAGSKEQGKPYDLQQKKMLHASVWRHGDTYYMVCGASRDNKAQALLYRSDDMIHWTFFNVLAESRGEWGYMWECPDFYPAGERTYLLRSEFS